MGPLNVTDRMRVFVLYLTDVKKKEGIFIEDRLFKWDGWLCRDNVGAHHIVSTSVALLKVIAGTTFIFNYVQAKLSVCTF